MFISKNFSFNRRALLPRFSSAPGAPGIGVTVVRALVQRLTGAFQRRGAAAGALEHLATLPLGTQPSLVLVRLGGETLLLGATAQQISLLTKSSADLSGVPQRIDEILPHEETTRQ
jgi:flagellar biogenesis protein FliO